MRLRVPVISRMKEKLVGRAIQAVFFGSQSKAGSYVNDQTAMAYSAVYGCVRVIAETLGSIPLHLYERTDSGRRVAFEHDLDYLLHSQPNPLMDAVVFRETMMGHVLLWGNAYAEIEFDFAGNILALWPLTPDRVEPRKTQDGDVFYHVRLPEGGEKDLPGWAVFHIMGYSTDGLMGKSVLSVIREATGLGLALEEFSERFFRNGTNIGGVVECPGKLSTDAFERLKTDLKEKYQGLSKAHQTIILEEGMKYARSTIPPADSQMLESRRYQTEEIARFYRVPLHLLQNLDRATNNNIEQQGIDFVRHCIMPWAVKWEAAILRQLIFLDDRKRFYAKFNLAGLERGELKSRYEAYAIGRQWGWLSANDVREMEDMNRLPDKRGDIYYTPMNMIPAELAAPFIESKIQAAGQKAIGAPSGGDAGGKGGDPNAQ